MSVKLNTEIKFLKGVGEKRAKLYKKISIETIGDLLHYYPRDYIDATTPTDLSKTQNGENVVLKLIIGAKSDEQMIRKGLSVFKVSAYDSTADVEITFFNGKYTVANLQIEEEYIKKR